MDYPEDEDNMVVAENSGGRVRYAMDQPVRYVEMDGSISGVYLVKQERSDRKGHITLQEQNGTRVVRTHHRRIIDSSVKGMAVVVESQDRLWALCPDDGEVVEVEQNQADMTCPKCDKTFPLYWNGVRPMADATKTEKAPKAEKAEKAPKTEKAAGKTAPKPKVEKAPKEPKAVKEPVAVDLAALAKHKHVELWTKKNVKFDHERIDVQAHTMLFTGDEPRKLCFNTYNGALGKRAPELPVEAFLSGTSPKGSKKDPWFPVANLDKTRTQLTNDGYEQHK